MRTKQQQPSSLPLLEADTNDNMFCAASADWSVSHSHRTVIWDIVRTAGMHRVWAPFMVDAALNMCSIATPTSLKDILENESFLAACRSRAEQQEVLKSMVWTPDGIVAACHSAVLPIDSYVRRVYSGIAKQLRLATTFGSPDYDDCIAIIRSEIYKIVDTFVPVNDAGNGKPWGFEAFLSLRVPHDARRAIIKTLGMKKPSVSMESFSMGDSGYSFERSLTPDATALVSHTPSPGMSFEFTELDLDSLESLIDTSAEARLAEMEPALASAYLLYVAGVCYRDIAPILNTTKSTVARWVESAARAVLQDIRSSISVCLGIPGDCIREEILGYFNGDDNRADAIGRTVDEACVQSFLG